MASYSRRKMLGGARMAVFHCRNNCVRDMFLCGIDPVTGKDYSHRRGWMMERLALFAALFAIDVEFLAIMSNHYHVVLRTMPRVAGRWSREEVVRRWLTATRLAKHMCDGLPTPDPDPKMVEELARDKRKVKKLRKRLCNVSWFMGLLSENIARRANQEDGKVGKFWRGRFKMRECTDENAVLICGLYVDLNPIRAGEATGPETAVYTSAYRRIQAFSQSRDAPDRADGWLAELTVPPERKEDVLLAYGSRTGRRASDLGILPISLETYLALLGWVADAIQSGQRDTIPSDLEPVLEGLSIKRDAFWNAIDDYENSFCHVVGPPDSLAEVADRMGVSYLRGATASRAVFG